MSSSDAEDLCITSSQLSDIRFAHSIISFLSLVSTIISLATYFIFKHFLRMVNFRYIAYLTLGNLLYTAANFSSSFFITDDLTCIILAFVSLYGSFCSIGWACILAYSVYRFLSNNTQPQKHEAKYLLLGFVAPVFAPIISLFLDGLGNYHSVYCLFNNSGLSGLPYILCGYVVGESLLLFMIFVTILSMKQAYQAFAPVDARKFSNQMIWFPIAMIFTMGMYSITNLIVDLHHCSGFTLTLIAITCRTSEGFINSMIYGFNRHVRMEMRSSMRRWSKGMRSDPTRMEVDSISMNLTHTSSENSMRSEQNDLTV